MYAVPLKLRNICITCRYIENMEWDRIILDKFQNDVDWRMTQISNVSPSKYDWGFHYNQNGSNNPLNGLCKNLNSFVSADSTISRQSLVQYNLTLVCVIIRSPTSNNIYWSSKNSGGKYQIFSVNMAEIQF